MFYRVSKIYKMSREILDDMDWKNEESEENRAEHLPYSEQEVVMLKTFNTEEQAHICAVVLKNEGIDAHVITSATGQMTPFAYGMVRLYVAESQVDDATTIIKRTEAQDAVYENPQLSSSRILMVILVGLLAIGLIIGLVQYFL
jgi:ABC-type methionine transport system ATPase subunit